MATIVEFTGSPKPFFKTKELFMEQLSKFGFEHGKITKKNNEVDLLICEDMDLGSSKLRLAEELNIKVVTYLDLIEEYDLDTDL
jgi:hypothetical protein